MWVVVESVVGRAPALLIARPILPEAFNFAGRAMIFVMVEEIVSESQRSIFTQTRGGYTPNSGDIPQADGSRFPGR